MEDCHLSKEDILQYLYGLGRFGIKLDLEVMGKFLPAIGNPHQQFKTIHVAGTNGKGSTCAYLASILQEAGYRVGLYTSPHLVRFNERIQVNRHEIKDEELVFLVQYLRQEAEGLGLQPTFFEFTTALAFQHFARCPVDYAVIETGLGGRLDATNVIDPEVMIITSIAFDHQQHLGHSLLEIAREKAGIIKRGKKVITGEKKEEIVHYFQQVCLEKNAHLLAVARDSTVKVLEQNLQGQTFISQGLVSGKYFIPLLGPYQVTNALGAILAAQELGISSSAIQRGLAKTTWAGRFQVLQENPLVVVDGAHNVQAFEELAQFLQQFSQRKLLVLGIAKDKEIISMLRVLAPLFSQAIVSQGNFKPANPRQLAEEVKKYIPTVFVEPNPERAYRRALALSSPQEMILITGSLYFVGDVLKWSDKAKI